MRYSPGWQFLAIAFCRQTRHYYTTNTNDPPRHDPFVHARRQLRPAKRVAGAVRFSELDTHKSPDGLARSPSARQHYRFRLGPGLAKASSNRHRARVSTAGAWAGCISQERRDKRQRARIPLRISLSTSDSRPTPSPLDYRLLTLDSRPHASVLLLTAEDDLARHRPPRSKRWRRWDRILGIATPGNDPQHVTAPSRQCDIERLARPPRCNARLPVSSSIDQAPTRAAQRTSNSTPIVYDRPHHDGPRAENIAILAGAIYAKKDGRRIYQPDGQLAFIAHSAPDGRFCQKIPSTLEAPVSTVKNNLAPTLAA